MKLCGSDFYIILGTVVPKPSMQLDVFFKPAELYPPKLRHKQIFLNQTQYCFYYSYICKNHSISANGDLHWFYTYFLPNAFAAYLDSRWVYLHLGSYSSHILMGGGIPMSLCLLVKIARLHYYLPLLPLLAAGVQKVVRKGTAALRISHFRSRKLFFLRERSWIFITLGRHDLFKKFQDTPSPFINILASVFDRKGHFPLQDFCTPTIQQVKLRAY